MSIEAKHDFEKEILKLCLEKKILLDSETFKILLQLSPEEAKKIINTISELNEKIITKSFITKNVEEIGERIVTALNLEKQKK